jgi:hypothetical protein
MRAWHTVDGMMRSIVHSGFKLLRTAIRQGSSCQGTAVIDVLLDEEDPHELAIIACEPERALDGQTGHWAAVWQALRKEHNP